ncbi:SNAP25 likeous protein SNAP33 [Apostasia shenzhenica]|uniref:SNAP25 likeous protein SNAP33 n=1 Tax=Apostasia shenzhenica TaxID=1088818 RepID=A0A2I0BDM0_9ASPA|nr:SNAP25 likeous protein SNAP33 [Apostasia shenzhenica]
MSKLNASKTPNSKIFRQNPVQTGFNPFDSDSDGEENPRTSRGSSAPTIIRSQHRVPHSSYNGHEERGTSQSSKSASSGFQYQSMQELESYAVKEAEETTQKINGCLNVAEEMREVSSRTLVNLHQQGEQITRTHLTAADIDHDLSRGEKLLGSLGSLFSKTWKPKKTREIKGPVLTRDDSFIRRGSHMEQRQKLGLDSSRPRSNHRQYPSEPSSAVEQVEVEKAKQDDALLDLSNILGELKAMAVDMGSEIDRYYLLILPLIA